MLAPLISSLDVIYCTLICISARSMVTLKLSNVHIALAQSLPFLHQFMDDVVEFLHNKCLAVECRYYCTMGNPYLATFAPPQCSTPRMSIEGTFTYRDSSSSSNSWMTEWMHEWMNEWMNEWMKFTYKNKAQLLHCKVLPRGIACKSEIAFLIFRPMTFFKIGWMCQWLISVLTIYDRPDGRGSLHIVALTWQLLWNCLTSWFMKTNAFFFTKTARIKVNEISDSVTPAIANAAATISQSASTGLQG